MQHEECGHGAIDWRRHVIDYTREDFTQSGQLYDLIMGANAYHSIFDYRRALSQDGIYVIVGGGLPQIVQAMSLGRNCHGLEARRHVFL